MLPGLHTNAQGKLSREQSSTRAAFGPQTKSVPDICSIECLGSFRPILPRSGKMHTPLRAQRTTTILAM